MLRGIRPEVCSAATVTPLIGPAAPGYALALLSVFWISAYPYQIKARTAGKSTTLTYYFARQFWQPSLWGAGVWEVGDLQRGLNW